MSKSPTLRYERSLKSSGHRLIAGCDEVGRGALAGPVSVGMVVVDVTAVRALKGVRDSKLLTAADREALVPRIRRWAFSYGVGHASPQEIDDVGLMVALRRAGNRAWSALQLHARPDAVVLDGNHDWLSAKDQGSLFESMTQPVPVGTRAEGFSGESGPSRDSDHSFDPDRAWDSDRAWDLDRSRVPGSSGGAEVSAEAAMLDIAECTAPVYTKIKADLQCLSVAAASVLAKVERDAQMAELAKTYPAYGWEMNKGYATPTHRKALNEHGPAFMHRRSWNLMSAPIVEGSGAESPSDEGSGAEASGAEPRGDEAPGAEPPGDEAPEVLPSGEMAVEL